MAWLAEALRIEPGRTVVDVGAGTGKFSALLVPTGARIVAIEPLDSMRAALVAELPGVEAVAGTAESMPLGDASADAIVAAQAFHWFDLSRALPEFWRVLRPTGRLGVVWNDLDVSVDWVAEFNAIISVPRAGTPLPSDAGRADLGRWFGEPQRAQFRHAHPHTRASLLERVQSMSFVAVLEETPKARVFEQVSQLLDSHPQLTGHETFDLPYVTEAFWAPRRDV